MDSLRASANLRCHFGTREPDLRQANRQLGSPRSHAPVQRTMLVKQLRAIEWRSSCTRSGRGSNATTVKRPSPAAHRPPASVVTFTSEELGVSVHAPMQREEAERTK